MYVVEITFECQIRVDDTEQISGAIDTLLGSLRMNGQILGREYPIANIQDGFRSYIMVSEREALSNSKANLYVLNAVNKLKMLNVKYSWKIIGSESESAGLCMCKKSSFFILYTNYLGLESPLRCGECFGTVPLYNISAAKDNEYVDILTWESDYKACDTLQMNCSTGERFGNSQLSTYNSSLSKRGIDICNWITSSTRIPTYYYLMKATGRSKRAEMIRKCPSCNGEWSMKEPLHDIFDFKCDKCRLLSNIGWTAR